MKIYINTLTYQSLADINEQEAKDGIPKKDLTKLIATISGELFIPGEWKHVTDQWVAINTTALAKCPYIKEAHIVAEERTKQALEEKGLDTFALGLKEAASIYGTAIPAIATDIEKYAKIEIAKGG